MSNLVDKDMRYISKTKQIRKCNKCGHSIDFGARMPFILCNWCGAKIYKNDKEEFKGELLKNLKKRGGIKCK